MPLALYLSKSRCGGGVRGMRHHRRIPEEEGLFRRDGLVDEGEDGLHALAADFQTVVTVPSSGLRRKSAGHALRDPKREGAPSHPFAGLVAEVAFPRAIA